MAPIQLSPIWTPLICVWVWFPRRRVPVAPPPRCLYTIHLFSNYDSGAVNSFAASPPRARHIRHSSPAEFDSITGKHAAIIAPQMTPSMLMCF